MFCGSSDQKYFTLQLPTCGRFAIGDQLQGVLQEG